MLAIPNIYVASAVDTRTHIIFLQNQLTRYSRSTSTKYCHNNPKHQVQTFRFLRLSLDFFQKGFHVNVSFDDFLDDSFPPPPPSTQDLQDHHLLSEASTKVSERNPNHLQEFQNMTEGGTCA